MAAREAMPAATAGCGAKFLRKTYQERKKRQNTKKGTFLMG
jgi:hypothetical protein